jgi:hypothetical protein
MCSLKREHGRSTVKSRGWKSQRKGEDSTELVWVWFTFLICDLIDLKPQLSLPYVFIEAPPSNSRAAEMTYLQHRLVPSIHPTSCHLTQLWLHVYHVPGTYSVVRWLLLQNTSRFSPSFRNLIYAWACLLALLTIQKIKERDAFSFTALEGTLGALIILLLPVTALPNTHYLAWHTRHMLDLTICLGSSTTSCLHQHNHRTFLIVSKQIF